MTNGTCVIANITRIDFCHTERRIRSNFHEVCFDTVNKYFWNLIKFLYQEPFFCDDFQGIHNFLNLKYFWINSLQLLTLFHLSSHHNSIWRCCYESKTPLTTSSKYVGQCMSIELLNLHHNVYRALQYHIHQQ